MSSRPPIVNPRLEFVIQRLPSGAVVKHRFPKACSVEYKGVVYRVQDDGAGLEVLMGIVPTEAAMKKIRRNEQLIRQHDDD